MNAGEEFVADYLQRIEKCEFVDLNIATTDTQGEIDVVGINMKDKTVYFCEVAIHLQGLNYGDNKEKLEDKFKRDQIYAMEHFDPEEYTYRFMLWSPIVTYNPDAKVNRLEEIFMLKQLMKDKYNMELELVINDVFMDCFNKLKLDCKKESKELQSSILRTFQIETITEDYLLRHPKANIMEDTDGLPYLQGASWKEITRDERTYCAELFFEARKNTRDFVHWIHGQGVIKLSEAELNQGWEMGFEVCFYRDVLKHQEKLGINSDTIRNTDYSPKRTFDLCLFSDQHIIIIEAKAQQGFETKQLDDFAKDKLDIKKLLGVSDDQVKVSIIGLASSTYLNGIKRRKAGIPKVFDGTFSWLDLHGYIKNPVFKQANQAYKK